MTAPAAPAKKKKMVVIIGVLLVAAAGGYYFFFMNKASATTAQPKPGAVVAMDPMTLNLADGHYLKLGLGIELTASGDPKSFDTAKASDLAISEFSDRALADISSAKARDALKREYLAQLKKAYPDEVFGVYYKVFVMQ